MEEKKEKAKEEVDEKEGGKDLEFWQPWPFFSRDASLDVSEKEWARDWQVHVLRCQEHKAWYI